MMNLKCIMVREASQTQKTTYDMPRFCNVVIKVKIEGQKTHQWVIKEGRVVDYKGAIEDFLRFPKLFYILIIMAIT